MDLEDAFEVPKDYLMGVVKNDLKKMDGVERDENLLCMVLKSLARNESTLSPIKTMRDDVYDHEGVDVSVKTISSYLSALDRLYLFENQKPFNPNLRSRDRVGKRQKRHFTDPSLAIAALNATPASLLNDLETYGFMFESICERDLSIYIQSLGGKLYHYRDKENYELDAVVELNDGRWGAFEIKVEFHQIEVAAANLQKVCRYIPSSSKKGAPTFMCVICGMSSAAYRREDGIYVVPITAMKD